MKCPHCGYEHGWSGEILGIIKGDEGDFFTASNGIALVRDESYYSYDTGERRILGCPSCFKIFMGK